MKNMKKRRLICTIILLAGLCVFVFGAGASCIAGERIMTKHLENLYRLEGLMRDKPSSPPVFKDQYKYLRD